MPSAAATYTTRTPAMPSTGPAVGLLVATAASPMVLFALGSIGVFIPYASFVLGALALAAVIVTLVWLHGAFVALRGRTHFSPGMAVGGWFIPLANLFLPALILRDAWRASQGSGGGIAFVWMIAWWLATAFGVLRGMGVMFSSSGGPIIAHRADGVSLFEIDGISMDTFVLLHNVLDIGIDVAAYGLLALIVATVGRAQNAKPSWAPA